MGEHYSPQELKKIRGKKMYQFFIEQNQCIGDKISILGNDVNHIKNVLRMKSGERVRVSVRTNTEDGDAPSRSYFGIIDTILEDEVLIAIESEDENGTELANHIYLFQGLPKGDKMELIIQKAVELGVYEIIPVAMKNCVVKLDDKKAGNKVKRWQAISESAAKQSKRTLIPKIQMPLIWKEALKKAEALDIVLVPYENERGMEATREILQSIKKGQSIGIFVGPEGGFAPEEIEQIAPVEVISTQIESAELLSHVEGNQQIEPLSDVEENRLMESDTMGSRKTHRISLGRRILRTETAGLATLSMLVFCLDD